MEPIIIAIIAATVVGAVTSVSSLAVHFHFHVSTREARDPDSVKGILTSFASLPHRTDAKYAQFNFLKNLAHLYFKTQWTFNGSRAIIMENEAGEKETIFVPTRAFTVKVRRRVLVTTIFKKMIVKTVTQHIWLCPKMRHGCLDSLDVKYTNYYFRSKEVMNNGAELAKTMANNLASCTDVTKRYIFAH